MIFNDHEGGGEEWYRLRHLGYINADTVVLCFSISSPDSFLRMKEYWYPFTQKHCPKAELLLVGIKKDLRDDRDVIKELAKACLLYTSPSPRDQRGSRMPSSA